jgi:glycosyltransferase involved in cell wall biosynthesis
MTFPSISVAMPNYNQAGTLVRAIEAVLAQTLRPTEFLIIDDGSTDGSVEIIRDYRRRHDFIRVIEHGVNRGIVQTARELCLEARSDYAVFAASDDWLAPECLEVLIRQLACNPEAAFAFGNPVMENEADGTSDTLHMLPTTRAAYMAPAEFTRLELLNAFFRPSLSWMPMHCAVIRMDLLRGVWLDFPELKWHADLFMLYVLALRHGVCYWPASLVHIRTSPTDYSKGQHSEAEKAVVLEMWRLLHTETFADVRDLFLKSGVFRHFATAWPPLAADPHYQAIVTAAAAL